MPSHEVERRQHRNARVAGGIMPPHLSTVTNSAGRGQPLHCDTFGDAIIAPTILVAARIVCFWCRTSGRPDGNGGRTA